MKQLSARNEQLYIFYWFSILTATRGNDGGNEGAKKSKSLRKEGLCSTTFQSEVTPPLDAAVEMVNSR
jgi:hypothetical protein